ncbi:pantoate--beta-alanine ligase [Parafrankia discariae]|uniref:pantoate--beta-alanine ligase n=1 Tax=Parafrankia discariae TaxID=365528 RepID=UPI0003684FD7|nr:pantoate--beta-alanine ligase [Parafrankia discariae]
MPAQSFARSVPGPAGPVPSPPRATRAGRPAVARTRAELAASLNEPAASPAGGDGPRGVRAVVMTMGALHRGHAELIRTARLRADQVVVTIFVNPLQFGPGEDLDRYPRTFEADLDLCAREGVDVVYAPTRVHDPAPLVTLSAGPLGDVLEGASRPGHFDGMLTLVGTMLHLVRPEVAFFGRKDAQQLVCIRRMVADLAFPVEIVGVPTVRDPDGLALSSRNAYLGAEQRRSALALSRALSAGAARAGAGAGTAAVLAAARSVLAAEPGVDVDYLTLASPSDLGPVEDGPALLLVAARVGSTRLIDNVELVLTGAAGPAPAGKEV